MNLVAGKRAKIATAYQPALDYLQTGLSLLTPQSWQTDYDLTLALHTEWGMLYRDVRAMSGYLSGDPARIHFGFPAGTYLDHLEIIWPDGAISKVEEPVSQTRLEISR